MTGPVIHFLEPRFSDGDREVPLPQLLDADVQVLQGPGDGGGAPDAGQDGHHGNDPGPRQGEEQYLASYCLRIFLKALLGLPLNLQGFLADFLLSRHEELIDVHLGS